MNDEFENHLKRQSLKPIPKDWRERILADSRVEPQKPARPLSLFLRFILLVKQRPRLGLGGIWILIGILNLTGPDQLKGKPLAMQKEPITPNPYVIAAIEQEFFRSRSSSEDNSRRERRQTEPMRPLQGPRSRLNTTTNRIII